MSYRQYIGARYVPKLMDEWNSTIDYEPLSVVSDSNGNSYTSKKLVPRGTPLSNREYWMETGSMSASIISLQNKIMEIKDALNETDQNVQNVSDDLTKEIIARKQADFLRPLRVFVVSDIHYDNEFSYAENASTRLQFLVDCIINENARKPLDAVLILGDLTTQNNYALSEKDNYLKGLYASILSAVPIPILTCAGNHDGFESLEYATATGTPRGNYYAIIGGVVFIFMDSYNISNNTTQGGSYKPLTGDILNEAFERYPDGRFVVCTHWSDPSLDTDSFKNAFQDDRVIGMIRGHAHTGHGMTTYEGKKVLQLGHFNVAINQSTILPIRTFDPYNPDCPWRYSILEMQSDGLHPSLITPEYDYYTSDNQDNTFHVPRNEIVYDAFTDWSNYEPTAPFNSREFSLIQLAYLQGRNCITLNGTYALHRGDDLNDFLDVGTYWCLSTAVRNTILNAPDALQGGFVMDVMQVTGNPLDNYTLRKCVQIIRPKATTDSGFFRYVEANYRSAWKAFTAS